MKQILAYVPAESDPFGIHREMVAALVFYRPEGTAVVAHSLMRAFALLKRCDQVYLQKTSPNNIWLALAGRILGKEVILYVHEPLSTEERVKKGVGRTKAWAVTTFQRVETFLVTKLLTGNPANIEYHGKPLVYAPLLLQPSRGVKAWPHRQPNILYFGRLDREKYFEEFRELQLSTTVVATSNLNITRDLPLVRPVSDPEKINAFESHQFVWCVQRHSFTQSAVVLDALRYGCCCLLRSADPLTKLLNPSEFIAIPPDFGTAEVDVAIKRYKASHPNGPSQESSFNQLCGQAAHDLHWQPNL